jgi:hypothetical protein
MRTSYGEECRTIRAVGANATQGEVVARSEKTRFHGHEIIVPQNGRVFT